jgi:hypothetical protein
MKQVAKISSKILSLFAAGGQGLLDREHFIFVIHD